MWMFSAGGACECCDAMLCRALGLEDRAQSRGGSDAHPASQQPSATASTSADAQQRRPGGSNAARDSVRPQPQTATAQAAFDATANGGMQHDREEAGGTTAAEHHHHHHLHADQVTSVSLRLSRPVHLQRCAPALLRVPSATAEPPSRTAAVPNVVCGILFKANLHIPLLVEFVFKH